MQLVTTSEVGLSVPGHDPGVEMKRAGTPPAKGTRPVAHCHSITLGANIIYLGKRFFQVYS